MSAAGPTYTVASSGTIATKILTPAQIERQGLHAVEAKTVSAPVLAAATALGRAQAKELGQPNAQHIATVAFIGYLNELKSVCTESPHRIASAVATVTLRLRNNGFTYSQVIRILYESTAGGPKVSCVSVIRAGLASG
jgi:hypothetical protein